MTPGAPRVGTALADQQLAEFEKEVIEDHELVPFGGLENTQDPVQRMLLTQMHQNTMLMQRMLQPRDTMSALLAGGGDNVSGSSSSGAKGCAARDLFLKQMGDLPEVADTVRRTPLPSSAFPWRKRAAF